MIRTIQSIKAFGVFNDFQWPSGLPDFKQFNLIYGWNYSGKTTLSRAFRCFEQNRRHVDFADAQVQLKAEDGTTHDLSAAHTAPVFRVFNSDFVRENLGFEVGNATPILILGAEDIAKQEMLKARKAERETLALSKISNEREKEDKNSAIEKALTKDARDLIKNPLAVPNYDKTLFERKVVECKADPDSDLLDERTFDQCLSIYRATEKRLVLSAKVPSLSSVAHAQEGATALLARVVTANNPIPRLKENPTVESWVNEGRPLHVGKTTCQFCGQLLPPDLLAHLSGHFSTDYDNLMAELNALIGTLQSAQEEKVALDDKGDFYPELQERFATEKIRLDDLLEARKSALAAIEKAVVAKKTRAFTRLECPATDDTAAKIDSAVKTINKTITEHNNRTAEFDEKRKQAFAKIEKHYAASFVRDQRYNEVLRQVAALETTIAEQGRKLGELDTELRALEEELSEASKGAGRINELLLAYFGKDDLRVEVSADKTFQIVRGGVVAKNLSEGEETAIAFAYFITRVQDRRHPLAETIVVIDDPVSSLDANHLFNTYALIKTQLGGCRQLFIATHSFEFYDLIRDWVAEVEGPGHEKKPQANWNRWGVFLVKRTDDGRAMLEEIPKELLKFKSEYHYLFSTLYHFDKNGAGDFDCLLSLPNVVRRFMEAFGGIMIPRRAGLHSKMPRLFPDEIERERVWKFINHYSHNTSVIRSLTIPDMGECKAVVQACLKAVREWDADYFQDLETEVIVSVRPSAPGGGIGRDGVEW
jgi:wobble nucleotide-excising tRNase